MKVLHIIDGIGPPGARGPELIYAHLKKLAEQGIDVHILTLITDEYTASGGFEWARQQEKKHNIKVYFIKNPFIKYGQKAYKLYLIFSRVIYFFRALMLEWKNRYDIINDFSSSALIFYRTALLGFLSKARVVHTLCTYNLGFFSSYRFWGGIRYLDGVICLSRHMADKISSLPASGRKVNYFPLGVEWRRFSDCSGSLEVKKKYDLPDDKIKVLYLGPIKKDKGIFVLSEAACKLPPDLNLHFIFACARFLMSNREKKQRIRMLNKSMENSRHTFQIISELVDVPGLMCSCDIVVLPQLTPHGTIAYPVTLLEAMAASKAVIASRTEGINELIEHKKNGFLFAPGSSDELVYCIKTLVKEPALRKRIGETAGGDIKNEHNLDLAVSNLSRIYRDLAFYNDKHKEHEKETKYAGRSTY